jgi:urease accessory protein
VNRQDPPWKVVRAFPQPGAGVLVHLNNVSGGVLAGDRLALDVTVEAGAAAQITTTGATRLYRHRAGSLDSEQTTTFSVGEKARLEYLPDPLIPYAGSRHIQRTRIRLAAGAALFWWETLAPGRQAAGESFAFERLQIESEVRTGERLLLKEAFLLEPAKRPLAVTARMREYSYIASLYVCQDGRPAAFWRALEDVLNAAAQQRTRPGQAMWGASTLVADGVMVRGLSASNRFIPAALTDFWRLARRAVTGEDPIPPRKIY